MTSGLNSGAWWQWRWHCETGVIIRRCSSQTAEHCIPRDSSSSSLLHLTLFLLNTWLGLGTTLGRLKERFIAEVMGGIFIKYVTAYEEDLPAYLNFLSILFCGIWGNEDLKLPFKPCFIFWKCCRPFPFCIDSSVIIWLNTASPWQDHVIYERSLIGYSGWFVNCQQIRIYTNHSSAELLVQPQYLTGDHQDLSPDMLSDWCPLLSELRILFVAGSNCSFYREMWTLIRALTISSIKSKSVKWII